MINVFQKEAFINFPRNPFKGVLSSIPVIIEEITNENTKINKYFDEFEKYRQRIVSFNKNLIKLLKVYALIQEKP